MSLTSDMIIVLVMAYLLLVLIFGSEDKQYKRASRSWEFAFGGEMPKSVFVVARWIIALSIILIFLIEIWAPR